MNSLPCILLELIFMYKSEWLYQNLIYSECISDVGAFAVYMPLKITKIDDTMATIMITMYHQLTLACTPRLSLAGKIGGRTGKRAWVRELTHEF